MRIQGEELEGLGSQSPPSPGLNLSSTERLVSERLGMREVPELRDKEEIMPTPNKLSGK